MTSYLDWCIADDIEDGLVSNVPSYIADAIKTEAAAIGLQIYTKPATDAFGHPLDEYSAIYTHEDRQRALEVIATVNNRLKAV